VIPYDKWSHKRITGRFVNVYVLYKLTYTLVGLSRSSCHKTITIRGVGQTNGWTLSNAYCSHLADGCRTPYKLFVCTFIWSFTSGDQL